MPARGRPSFVRAMRSERKSKIMEINGKKEERFELRNLPLARVWSTYCNSKEK